MSISLVLLSAGSSSRFQYPVKKQWLRIGDKPLWLFVADRLSSFYEFEKVIITADEKEVNLYKSMCDYEIVCGDKERQLSLKRALDYVESEFVLVSDVARACISKELVDRILSIRADSVVPYLDVVDTVVYDNKTIDREKVKLIQTPQLSKTSILKNALAKETIFTDERGAIESVGGEIVYVKGDADAKKITFFSDLLLSCLKAPNKDYFTGIGYDSHRFEENKEMYLGGVKIDVDYGFKAHSDGDVLIHSIIDALLGAAGYSDIGEFFPDNDSKYKGISSSVLLTDIISLIKKTGFEIVNIDSTIIAQKPRLSNFKLKIKKNLEKIIGCRVNIKATTNEKMGFVGREEGVAVLSVATLKYKDWYEDSNSRK